MSIDHHTGADTPDTGHDHTPAVPEEPIANPGLPAHTYRPTDVDPAKEKRAERQVAALFDLSAVFTVLFVVAYFAFEIGETTDTVLNYGASHIALGTTLGLALLCIGIGVIQWARKLMGDHEIVEMRHPARSSDEDREGTLAALSAGAEESGIGRRPLVRNSLLGALGVVSLGPLVLLRDLGPTPGQVADSNERIGADGEVITHGRGLENTLWGANFDGLGPPRRVVRDTDGTPIRAADLEIGDLVNGVPDGIFALHGAELQIAKSKGAVIVVKMEPDEIKSDQTSNWSVDGVICYSKICTHVGCPISLYERTTHHVLCPCHQSTFDLADSAKVVFGPAARPLPQLPLAVDDEGYLVATGDFEDIVGPSYWEMYK